VGLATLSEFEFAASDMPFMSICTYYLGEFHVLTECLYFQRFLRPEKSVDFRLRANAYFHRVYAHASQWPRIDTLGLLSQKYFKTASRLAEL